MSTPATRVNGAQITSLVSCPVASGTGGLWWDGNTTGPKWRKADGTDVTLGAGGGGTQAGSTSSPNVPYATGANTLGDSELQFTSATHTFNIGASTVMDFSASSGAFKTSTGTHTFGGSTYNIPAAATVQNTAQGMTNTTGMTIATNVADGASSIGLKINNTTAMSTSGCQLVTISNGGSLKSAINDLGTYNNGGAGFRPGATSYWDASYGNPKYAFTSGSLSPFADNGPSSGANGSRWNSVWGYWYDTKLGTALPSAATITPTSGLHHVTGTTTISTIAVTNVPASSQVHLRLIFDGVAPWNAAGNIAVAGTPTTAGTTVDFVYDPATSKWYPGRTA